MVAGPVKLKVTIDRAKWRCGGDDNPFQGGNGKGDTKLLNCEGYLCCLGFITREACPDLELLDKSEPDDLPRPVWGLSIPKPSGVGRKNTKLTFDAIRINDDEDLSFEEREAKLLELFKDSPYELEFVGQYEDLEVTNDQAQGND